MTLSLALAFLGTATIVLVPMCLPQPRQERVRHDD